MDVDGNISRQPKVTESTGLAIGGSMIFAGIVAMGVVFGNLLLEKDDEEEESKTAPGDRLLLISDDGKPIKFDDIGWEQQGPHK